jgi:hypothetical protein
MKNISFRSATKRAVKAPSQDGFFMKGTKRQGNGVACPLSGSISPTEVEELLVYGSADEARANQWVAYL